jgi:hypothetical protein
VIAALAIIGAALLLPAVAGAQTTPKITLSAYPVSLDAAPAGGNSLVEPAISAAADGSNAEWFVLSGRTQNLISISPTGQQSTVASGLASDNGAPVTYASVDADGYDWILDNDQGPGNVLYAVGAADSPSPGLNPVARFGDYGQDMTLGPDGSLYIADNDGIIRCRISSAPSASCATESIPSPFYTGAGAFAVDGGGNAVWFTDGSGGLGAYSSNGFSGPYPAAGTQPGSTDPGTVVTAANGYVYMANGGGPGSGNNTEIVNFSPGDPSQVNTVTSGLGNIVAMTVGPDGNVWFIDAGGNGSIDELNIATNQVTGYGLPNGLSLPSSGWRIAAGPSVPNSNGTGEVFFTATTAPNGLGNAAIGEVSGIPFPVTPGALAFKTAVSVSKQHVALLTFTCSGQSNAGCAGNVNLSVKAKLRVKVQISSAHVRYRTRTQRAQLALGNIAYDVRGGRSVTSKVKLTSAAYKLLEQVVGHSWSATVTSTTTLGTVSGTQLTMTGPTPPRPKVRKHRKAKKHKRHG